MIDSLVQFVQRTLDFGNQGNLPGLFLALALMLPIGIATIIDRRIQRSQ